MTTSNLGPNLPNLDGILHYALSASEMVQYGYYGGGVVTHSTVLSGDVAYTAKSTIRPFSMLFSAGVILGNQSGQGTSYYTSATASQGYVTRHWDFNISDTVSYLPQSPTVGLSGIAGVGDLGSSPDARPERRTRRGNPFDLGYTHLQHPQWQCGTADHSQHIDQRFGRLVDSSLSG